MIAKEELDRALSARFSEDVREKLTQARVAIAGLGGLGSNTAVMLARTGIGHLLLVDYDIVDVTNLNRQAYSIPHIGMRKTEALQRILSEINPYISVETRQIRVDASNAAALFREYPIVCEAFDKAEAKAMLVNTLLTECSHTIVVSGIGMAGYGDANEIVTRRQSGRLYVCGDGKTDIDDGIGLMAPRVAVCAGHQANTVIQILLNGGFKWKTF